MSKTLKRIHQIRRYHEQRCRLDVTSAETERDALSAALEETEASISRSREDASLCPDDLALHHSYALRMEMQRRGEAQQVQDKQREVDSRRDVWEAARMDRRIMERLVEKRDLELQSEQARTEQAGLDEIAARGWWRNRDDEP